MNDILPSNETIKFEDAIYTNPQTSLDERNAFIDNLRNSQDARNAEINAQTYNLGTAVPSNLGGLTGGEGYFTSRYQVPQTNALVSDLRAAAQAQALNEALSNQLAMQKQRYNKAYKAAQRRAAARARAGYGNPGGGGAQDGIEKEDTGGKTFKFQSVLSTGYNADLYDQIGRITTVAEDLTGQYYSHRDDKGNIIYSNSPDYRKGSDGYYHPKSYFKEQAEKKAFQSSPAGRALAIGTALTQLMRR